MAEPIIIKTKEDISDFTCELMENYQAGELLPLITSMDYLYIIKFTARSFVVVYDENYNQLNARLGYVRVSTESQSERGYGISAQIDTIKDHCVRNELPLCAMGFDLGISADNRKAILKKIKSGEGELEYFSDVRPGIYYIINRSNSFNKIIVGDTSRLWRDEEITGPRVRGCIMCYGSDIHDISNPQYTLWPNNEIDLLVNTIRNVQSQQDKMTIVRRTCSGRKQKVKAGQTYIGAAPYGYRKNGTRLEIYEPEAKILRELFRLYDPDSPNPSEVAQYLNASGMLYKGKEWSRRAVSEKIRMKLYRGYISYGEDAQSFHPDLVIFR